MSHSERQWSVSWHCSGYTVITIVGGEAGTKTEGLPGRVSGAINCYSLLMADSLAIIVSTLPTRATYDHACITREASAIPVQSVGQTQPLITANTVASGSPMQAS